MGSVLQKLSYNRGRNFGKFGEMQENRLVLIFFKNYVVNMNR